MTNTHVKYRDLIGPDFKGIVDIATSLNVAMMYYIDNEWVITLANGNTLTISVAEEDK